MCIRDSDNVTEFEPLAEELADAPMSIAHACGEPANPTPDDHGDVAEHPDPPAPREHEVAHRGASSADIQVLD